MTAFIVFWSCSPRSARRARSGWTPDSRDTEYSLGPDRSTRPSKPAGAALSR